MSEVNNQWADDLIQEATRLEEEAQQHYPNYPYLKLMYAAIQLRKEAHNKRVYCRMSKRYFSSHALAIVVSPNKKYRRFIITTSNNEAFRSHPLPEPIFLHAYNNWNMEQWLSFSTSDQCYEYKPNNTKP